jgi:hypothetical protein
VVVAVEVEHLEELLAMLFGEDWVFGDDVSGEYCLLVLLGVFLATVQHIFKILKFNYQTAIKSYVAKIINQSRVSFDLEFELSKQLTHFLELFTILDQIKMPVGQSLLIGEVSPIK